MDCALSLARLARGYASPNPAVGAVVVKDDGVVGMGYTQPVGGPHAEVVALQQAGENARGAVMYVTLEPCCHFGRTPPCTNAIIDAGVSEVHVAMVDPNPVVSGKGIKALNEAGIRTYVGTHEAEARSILEAYIKHTTTGLPFVIAKFAMSLDGKIATRGGHSQWISNEQARCFVHGVRHTVDAIMVGVNTLITDDPRLTARGCCGRSGCTSKQPLRIIADGTGRSPVDARVFNEPGQTLIATVRPFDVDKKKALEKTGVEVLELPGENGRVDLETLLRVVGERGVISVLMEGGSELLGYAFDHNLVDKVLAFIAPIIIGGTEGRTAVGGDGVLTVQEALNLDSVEVTKFADNVLVSGYVRTAASVSCSAE
ncbi:MAG: bifunctional diaminohydroxyphosphoribosylaminopyrimidine deaminase/5-amino-6-(5-phosphoribosylamino)uracil reductase RibD [Dehalococcoidia bacterium]|nr:bifunctional diaminohydroxyphosphoribosylaminopyrimidine deaminase/5-amino-6-(5-phosphoribosylamino)uracil reductase RibD [Dehalococcoidia bacterium]